MVSIPLVKSSQYADSDTISLTGNQSVPAGTLEIVEVVPDADGLHTLTVPNEQGHLIINGHGSFAFDVATTGNSTITLAAGESASIAWNVTSASHIIAQGAGATQPYIDGEVDDGNITGATTVDFSTSTHRAATITGDVTLTFTAPGRVGDVIWVVTQDATGYHTIDWTGVAVETDLDPEISLTPNSTTVLRLYYDGTTYRRSSSGVNLLSQDLVVNDFGAPIGGGNSDHTVVNQVLGIAANGLRGRVVFKPEDYYFNDSIILPTEIGNNPRLELVGYGAKLRTFANDVTILKRTIPAISGWGGSNSAFVPVISGFHFVGQATNTATAGTGIRLDGYLSAVIKDCSFLNLYRGMHLIWNICATISNCNTGGCLQSYLATSGAFESAISDGTVTNSNCNLVTFERCRAQVTDSSAIGFRLQGAGQSKLDRCICEGTAGDIGYLIQSHDGTSSTTVRDTLLENCWMEGNLNTIFQFEVEESTIVVRGGRLGPRTGTSPNETVFIRDTSSFSKDSHYIVDGVDFKFWNGSTDPWFVNQANTSGDRNAWTFQNNMFDPTEAELVDASFWSNTPSTSILLNATNNIFKGTSSASWRQVTYLENTIPADGSPPGLYIVSQGTSKGVYASNGTGAPQLIAPFSADGDWY